MQNIPYISYEDRKARLDDAGRARWAAVEKMFAEGSPEMVALNAWVAEQNAKHAAYASQYRKNLAAGGAR